MALWRGLTCRGDFPSFNPLLRSERPARVIWSIAERRKVAPRTAGTKVSKLLLIKRNVFAAKADREAVQADKM